MSSMAPSSQVEAKPRAQRAWQPPCGFSMLVCNYGNYPFGLSGTILFVSQSYCSLYDIGHKTPKH